MPEIVDPTSIPPVTFWDLYAEKIVKTAIYPGQSSITGLTYVGLGLAGETGEFCDQCKKIIRDDGNVLVPVRQDKLCGELGDVLWYLGGAARELRVSLSEVVMVVPPAWVSKPLPGMGTPTALSIAAFRLQRATSQFTQQVENVFERGGIVGHDDHTYLRLHMSAAYYAANLCAQQLGRDLRQIGADNVDKLFSRRDRGVLQGSGSDR